MSSADQLGEWLHANWNVAVIAIFAVLGLIELIFGSRTRLANTGLDRLATNFGLQFSNILVVMALPISLSGIAIMAPEAGPALVGKWQLPGWIVLAAVILGRTFLAYWLHRLEHAVPLLWRFHKVHHTDPQLDITTGLRHHPVETLLVLATYGALLLLFSPPIWAFAIAELLMFANQLWQHVPMRRREWLARPLGCIFATPENHSVHHSSRRSQTDSNYGVLLIIWDRLFGTYTDPFSAGEMRYGLGDGEDARAANLLAQLCLPFMRARPAVD